jgi:hypothetical protein
MLQRIGGSNVEHRADSVILVATMTMPESTTGSQMLYANPDANPARPGVAWI